MMSNLKFILILLIILLILLYPYNSYKKNLNREYFNNGLKYFRCTDKKLGQITNNIFQKFGISKTNSK